MKNIANEKNGMLLEQFIPDHVFFYIPKGTIRFFDGLKVYTLRAGESSIVRKNTLLRYEWLDEEERAEPVLFCFDEPYLRDFQTKHSIASSRTKDYASCLKLGRSRLIENFIHSLEPYHKSIMKLDEAFEDLKYEELLIILLREERGLAGLFFDFSKPGRINLEAFMNRNFKFNVSLERFAFLTGRSLSAFKRDFKTIFQQTPSRWLVQKRLEEAHFMLVSKNRKPSEFYTELGFETLSHFSVAFKKHYGINPATLLKQQAD